MNPETIEPINETPIRTDGFINTEDVIKCNWCNEEYPESELVKEKDLGYLCNTCVNAILSRGEHLTIEY